MILESLENHLYATKAPTPIRISWYHEQASMTHENWTPYDFFIGPWKGSGEGRTGHSHVERKYELVLNKKFLFVQHKSVYEPQEKNPHGEIHEDWGLISYDRARETYVFRQFQIEGFVNQYVLDKIAEAGQSIRFVTEEIENISSGWQARETYQILGPDEFVEVFELGGPGKGFKRIISSVFTQNRNLWQ